MRCTLKLGPEGLIFTVYVDELSKQVHLNGVFKQELSVYASTLDWFYESASNYNIHNPNKYYEQNGKERLLDTLAYIFSENNLHMLDDNRNEVTVKTIE